MATTSQMSMPMSFGTAGRSSPLLLLLDGHAMVHRSFRAISASRNLTVSSTGEDVTGVYGFAQRLYSGAQRVATHPRYDLF